MSDIAVRVENLSKQYKIVATQHRHDTLKGILADGLRSMFRRGGRPNKDRVTIWALKNVSFEVEEGEIVGIIGSNGSGKSTLLKILSRITKPSGGLAEIYGAVGSLLEVGTGFSGELSGRENIYMNGAILGMKKAEIDRKFDEIVSFSEVERFIDTPVKHYSSGMYVRLAFAVAAHLEPEILFVDEVLAVGDVSFQKKCLGKMDDVAKEGRTVFFVSHNMIAINSLCRRAIWLNSGATVEDGPAGHVVARYLAGSAESTGLSEEVWDEVDSAPGNDMVRLHRVRIRPQEDSPSDSLTMQTPFVVEVEYWNLLADAHLHITLHLYTAQGLIAFTTGSVFDPVWSDRPMPAGLFRSVGFFPGNLLNSGQHRFVVLVVKDKSSVIYSHESRVSFDILDLRERQGTWYGTEPGVVQPVLKWKTEYLDEDPGIKVLSR
jgi:lipopolysaccharide transport system ATP-binding protein